jgi:hypothetical protein
MSASSSTNFPSGIPNPPIFARLGPKDRGRIRQNIEATAANEARFDNMTTEQTYVFRFSFRLLVIDKVVASLLSSLTAFRYVSSINCTEGAIENAHEGNTDGILARPRRRHHLPLRKARLQACGHQAHHTVQRTSREALRRPLRQALLSGSNCLYAEFRLPCLFPSIRHLTFLCLLRCCWLRYFLPRFP